MADRYVEVAPDGTSHRSMAEIIQDIATNLQEMVRSEFRLAKAELTDRAKQAGKAAGILGAGIAVLAVAALLIVVTCVAALALVMPVWLASLIMAVLLGMVGGGMAMAGRSKLKHANLKPENTIHSVKEDVEWLKQQTR